MLPELAEQSPSQARIARRRPTVAGGSYAMVDRWRRVGLDSADGLRWHRAGFGIKEATRWRLLVWTWKQQEDDGPAFAR